MHSEIALTYLQVGQQHLPIIIINDIIRRATRQKFAPHICGDYYRSRLVRQRSTYEIDAVSIAGTIGQVVTKVRAIHTHCFPIR
jgi:hypothetical protein